MTKFTRYLVASAAVGLMAVASGTSPASSTSRGSDSVGAGGAGAFIRPAHVNGPFGAGGPCAGLGGAGAFIPMTLPAACAD